MNRYYCKACGRLYGEEALRVREGPKGPRLFCKKCGKIVKQTPLPPSPDETTRAVAEPRLLPLRPGFEGEKFYCTICGKVDRLWEVMTKEGTVNLCKECASRQVRLTGLEPVFLS